MDLDGTQPKVNVKHLTMHTCKKDSVKRRKGTAQACRAKGGVTAVLGPKKTYMVTNSKISKINRMC